MVEVKDRSKLVNYSGSEHIDVKKAHMNSANSFRVNGRSCETVDENKVIDVNGRVCLIASNSYGVAYSTWTTPDNLKIAKHLPPDIEAGYIKPRSGTKILAGDEWWDVNTGQWYPAAGTGKKVGELNHPVMNWYKVLYYRRDMRNVTLPEGYEFIPSSSVLEDGDKFLSSNSRWKYVFQAGGRRGYAQQLYCRKIKEADKPSEPEITYEDISVYATTSETPPKNIKLGDTDLVPTWKSRLDELISDGDAERMSKEHTEFYVIGTGTDAHSGATVISLKSNKDTTLHFYDYELKRVRTTKIGTIDPVVYDGMKWSGIKEDEVPSKNCYICDAIISAGKLASEIIELEKNIRSLPEMLIGGYRMEQAEWDMLMKVRADLNLSDGMYSGFSLSKLIDTSVKFLEATGLKLPKTVKALTDLGLSEACVEATINRMTEKKSTDIHPVHMPLNLWEFVCKVYSDDAYVITESTDNGTKIVDGKKFKGFYPEVNEDGVIVFAGIDMKKLRVFKKYNQDSASFAWDELNSPSGRAYAKTNDNYVIPVVIENICASQSGVKVGVSASKYVPSPKAFTNERAPFQERVEINFEVNLNDILIKD